MRTGRRSPMRGVTGGSAARDSVALTHTKRRVQPFTLGSVEPYRVVMWRWMWQRTRSMALRRARCHQYAHNGTRSRYERGRANRTALPLPC